LALIHIEVTARSSGILTSGKVLSTSDQATLEELCRRVVWNGARMQALQHELFRDDPDLEYIGALQRMPAVKVLNQTPRAMPPRSNRGLYPALLLVLRSALHHAFIYAASHRDSAAATVTVDFNAEDQSIVVTNSGLPPASGSSKAYQSGWVTDITLHSLFTDSEWEIKTEDGVCSRYVHDNRWITAVVRRQAAEDQ
jgi:hypothetical protein